MSLESPGLNSGLFILPDFGKDIGRIICQLKQRQE